MFFVGEIMLTQRRPPPRTHPGDRDGVFVHQSRPAALRSHDRIILNSSRTSEDGSQPVSRLIMIIFGERSGH